MRCLARSLDDGDVEPHRRLERRARRERDEAMRRGLGHVDRVVDVADRLDAEEIAAGRGVDAELAVVLGLQLDGVDVVDAVRLAAVGVGVDRLLPVS